MGYCVWRFLFVLDVSVLLLRKDIAYVFVEFINSFQLLK